MGLIDEAAKSATSAEPLSMADVEDALYHLWNEAGDNLPTKGVLLYGDTFTGGMWLESDGVWRGYVHHVERGSFPVSRVGNDGPIKVEGWS
jgi:hypothetical protein